MNRRSDFDVAIIGAGPVGTYLANLLGAAGLSVALVEREAGVYPLPRAVHFDGEIMRAFQAIGLHERIGAVARASSKGMHFVSDTGQTLLIRRGQEGPGPHGWAGNYYIHQPHLEAVLRDGLRRFATVKTLFGHAVTALDDHASRVALSLSCTVGGATSSMTARYVVGCDGARSFVRGVIGAPLEDLGLSQQWLVLDAIVKPDRPRVRALVDHTIQLCDPARPMTLVYVGGSRHRWEIMLMPGDDAGAMTAPGHVWPLLSRWLTPGDAELERAAVYTFRSVIAHGWRKGRLLLAGDACHQTPPFLGQGMCAGLRDAYNLAWKLKAVLSERAPEQLLDSYESERRPHVHAFIKLAVEVGAIVQTTDREIARKRDAQFSTGTRMFDFPQPQLGPGVRMEAARPVGQAFPQPRFDDGRLLDEVTGRHFALLTGAAFRQTIPPSLRASLAAVNVAIPEAPSSAIAAWLDANNAAAVLIRPDGYVFAMPDSVEELGAAVAALRLSLGVAAHPDAVES